MVRETTLECWKKINEEGLLSKRRMEIYNALYACGPMTSNELFREMARVSERVNYNIVTRLGELRDMGVVIELDTRPCRVTGIEVIVWQVTNKLPIELPRKK